MTTVMLQRFSLSMVSFAIFLFQEVRSLASEALAQPISGITGVIDSPSFWLLVTAYAVFNAAVSAMPPPGSELGFLSGSFYRWAYTFLHTLSMNFIQAFGTKLQPPQKG